LDIKTVQYKFKTKRLSDHELVVHVVALRRQGLTYRQIASELGISYSNLRKRLWKLRKKGLYVDPRSSKNVTRKLQLVAIHSKPSDQLLIDIIKREGMIHLGELHRKLTQMGYRISRYGLSRKLARLEKKGVIVIKRSRGPVGNLIYYNTLQMRVFPGLNPGDGGDSRDVWESCGNRMGNSVSIRDVVGLIGSRHYVCTEFVHNSSRPEYNFTFLGFGSLTWSQEYHGRVGVRVGGELFEVCFSKKEFNGSQRPTVSDVLRRVRLISLCALACGAGVDEVHGEVDAAFRDFTERCVYVPWRALPAQLREALKKKRG